MMINTGMSAVIEEDSLDPHTFLKHEPSNNNLMPNSNSRLLNNDSDMMEVLMKQLVDSNENLEIEADSILSGVTPVG